MAALLCALGVLAAKVETWRAGTQMLGSEIQTRLTGRVVSLDQMANGRDQADDRRDFDGPAEAALCAGTGKALGTQDSRRYDRRLHGDRLCQAAAADRPGAAGQL